VDAQATFSHEISTNTTSLDADWSVFEYSKFVLVARARVLGSPNGVVHQQGERAEDYKGEDTHITTRGGASVKENTPTRNASEIRDTARSPHEREELSCEERVPPV
jgi:hypothetical protein